MTLLELLVENGRKNTWGWAKAARWAKGRQDVVAWRIIDDADVDFIANSSGEKVTKDQYEDALATRNEQKMKYEYLKGSEKDFDGAPEWATYLAELAKNKSIVWVSSDDNKYKYKFDSTNSQSGMSFEGKFINFMWEDRIEIIAERRQITDPSWDGVGMPPVGCECEFTLGPYETYEFDELVGKLPWPGTLVTVVSHKVTGDGHDVAVIYWDEDGGGRAACLVGSCLKPIRSEADKKREEAISEIASILEYRKGCSEIPLSGWIYTAIASGKIPGVKLED